MRNVGFPTLSSRSRRMSRCDNNNKNIDSLPLKFQAHNIRTVLLCYGICIMDTFCPDALLRLCEHLGLGMAMRSSIWCHGAILFKCETKRVTKRIFLCWGHF